MSTNTDSFFKSVFLADSRLNPPDEYLPYRCVRGYLRQKYENCGMTIPELAQVCGYTKVEKFRRHLELWLRVERPIPARFLDTIGAGPEMVTKVLELDFELWEEAVKRVGLPESFSARLMPAIWQSVPLPEGLNETQAVAYVVEYAKQKNRQCLINFGGLRVTWIDPDGRVYRRFRWPSLEYKNRMLHFTLSSRQPGTTRLAR